jgi:glutamyl-tRNA(Gln) amidotransferase subunit D
MYRGKAGKILKGIKVGDKIKVKKGEKCFEGILMPRSELGDEEHIVIKLKSGYNIGINVGGIKIE